MSTRQVRKIYPLIPSEVAEAQLCEELQAYYEALHSYPLCFAETGVSFQAHLLKVMSAVHGHTAGGGAERLKTAS